MPSLPPRKQAPRGERDVQSEIRAMLSRRGILHWRNNTGVLRDETGRPVTYGLCEGSADLIAIVPVDLGSCDGRAHVMGRFVAIEVKGPHTPVSPEQLAWIDLVERAGGVAGVARCVADAEVILERAQRW